MRVAESAINPFAGLVPAAAAQDDGGPAELGREDFLRLLITQIQHQDPLNPIENTEFTAQLAQFSSLEQLININDKLESLAAGPSREATVGPVLGLLGTEVVAESDVVEVTDGTASTVEYELSRSVGGGVAILRDSSGAEVLRVPLGALPAGVHTLDLDGRGAAGALLPDGLYTVEIQIDGGGNERVPVRTRGLVTGVELGEEPALLLGKRRVSLGQVLSVHLPALDRSVDAEGT